MQEVDIIFMRSLFLYLSHVQLLYFYAFVETLLDLI